MLILTTRHFVENYAILNGLWTFEYWTKKRTPPTLAVFKTTGHHTNDENLKLFLIFTFLHGKLLSYTGKCGKPLFQTGKCFPVKKTTFPWRKLFSTTDITVFPPQLRCAITQTSFIQLESQCAYVFYIIIVNPLLFATLIIL